MAMVYACIAVVPKLTEAGIMYCSPKRNHFNQFASISSHVGQVERHYLAFAGCLSQQQRMTSESFVVSPTSSRVEELDGFVVRVRPCFQLRNELFLSVSSMSGRGTVARLVPRHLFFALSHDRYLALPSSIRKQFYH